MRRRPNILIIEPRQNVRTFVEMTLSQERMRVFSALNLSSALLQLRVLRPDLIIVGFDGQDGEESAVVAQIRALSLAPLLALEHEEGSMPRWGIADTLPHPYCAGVLCAKIAELLGARQPLSAV